MTQKQLSFTRVTDSDAAAPTKWLYVAHGIFGAGRNWASVAKRVVRNRPTWGALLIDLREHGASHDFPAPHTLESAADDIAALAAVQPPPSALLGHSFGGKVALMYLRRHAAANRALENDYVPLGMQDVVRDYFSSLQPTGDR